MRTSDDRRSGCTAEAAAALCLDVKRLGFLGFFLARPSHTDKREATGEARRNLCPRGHVDPSFPNHEWIDEMQDFANLLLLASVYNLSTAQLIKASSTSERRVIGVVRFFFFPPQIPQRRRTQRSCGFVPGPLPSDARHFRL